MSKQPNIKAEKTAAKTLRIDIYDQIGPSWYGMIDAKQVSRLIKDAGEVDQINVHLNTPGGSVWEGLAIHNILKDHPARVLTKVDGVAASAGSVILMAGDDREVPLNALVMIHDPWTYAEGYASEMRKVADVLDTHKTAIVETYAVKMSKSKDEIAKLMTDETWFTGEESLAAGLATRTTAALTLPSNVAPNEVAAMYRRAPSSFSMLAALASGVPDKKESNMKTPAEIAAETAAAELKAKQEADAQAAADVKAKADAAAIAAAADEKAKEILAADRRRGADIAAACTLAGKPGLATKFIEDGATIADVNAKLLAEVCKTNAPVDDNAAGSLGNGTGGDPSNAKYEAEYAKNKANFAKLGVSKEDYIAGRRIDDGLDPLIKPAA